MLQAENVYFFQIRIETFEVIGGNGMSMGANAKFGPAKINQNLKKRFVYIKVFHVI